MSDLQRYIRSRKERDPEFARCRQGSLAEWQCRAYAARLWREQHSRPWWDRLADWLAFRVMDLAAVLSWFTWTTEKRQWIPALHVHDGITIFAGTYLDEYPRERWCYCEAMHWGAHDGWRPLRYEGRQAI